MQNAISRSPYANKPRKAFLRLYELERECFVQVCDVNIFFLTFNDVSSHAKPIGERERRKHSKTIKTLVHGLYITKEVVYSKRTPVLNIKINYVSLGNIEKIILILKQKYSFKIR